MGRQEAATPAVDFNLLLYAYLFPGRYLSLVLFLLLPEVGPKAFLNYKILDVALKVSKLQSRTHHNLELGGRNLHICVRVSGSFFRLSFALLLFVRALHFWATERYYFLLVLFVFCW